MRPASTPFMSTICQRSKSAMSYGCACFENSPESMNGFSGSAPSRMSFR
jgi:hypothetical protein